jgi:hypothetical protein
MSLTVQTLNGFARNPPTRAAPIDTLLTFRLGQAAMTASGWASGAIGSTVDLGQGRFQGTLNLQVHAADIGSGNKTYQFFLYGSNDPTFAAGNCDLLAAYDIAATAALRLGSPTSQSALWPGIGGGAFYTGPTTQPVMSAAIYSIPVSNDRDVFTLEFINLFCAIAGTTPSITFDAWLSPWTGQKY